MTTRADQEIVVDFDVPATMRDGTTLRANVYRPAGDGQWPVLLTRLPYGKDFPLGSAYFDPVQVARRGYVVVVQDTRGRFTSEGEWVPFVHEAQDGYDTVAWAAQLPQSNGSVGMYGISYFGFTQWATAVLQPPALKAIAPAQTWNDPFNGLSFRGGALELGTHGNWHSFMGLNVLMRRHHGDREALGREISLLAKEIDALGKEGYWSLPLREFGPLHRQSIAPYFFESFSSPMDVEHEMARPLAIYRQQGRVTVPALNVAGWYDIFLQDTINNFRALREHGSTPEARQSKLIIGPWTHGAFANPVGELNFGFGSTAAFIDLQIDLVSLQVRWFDHWLKGKDTGMLKEAPIKLFVMGANVWRDEQEWPLARAVNTRYYLHSLDRANSLHGNGYLTTDAPESHEPGSDHYAYDPANPVLTRGGALLMSPEYPAGPYDQRATESRQDVLVYTSGELKEDLEVTGPVTVHLWAASSAPDTDFVARLVDVHPDGYAQVLTDGIIRARYRNFRSGERQPSLIEPGKAYEYEIDLWATSNVFRAGHRIRLDITSSNFPRWDRNPNTGGDFGADTRMVVARQTILHDPEHASCVVLPVVPPA